MHQKVVVIVGPTASGKSALGIQLANKFGGEVISADSRQVYRGLDIGTGKVTKREMGGIPHHVLDIASPRSTITASDFAKHAEKVMERIGAHKHIPIVVGGTGFYIDTLTGRITLPDVPPNLEYRKTLQGKALDQLYRLLKKKDPKRAALMNTPSERNNKVRLIRALEVAMAGNSVSAASPPQLREYLWIGISPALEELDKNIQTRLIARLKRGMIAEAKRLHTAGLSYKRMEALGLEYRSLARFLQGRISRSELELELAAAIRRYARSQIRYWKRNKDIQWFRPNEIKKIEKAVANFISHDGARVPENLRVSDRARPRKNPARESV